MLDRRSLLSCSAAAGAANILPAPDIVNQLGQKASRVPPLTPFSNFATAIRSGLRFRGLLSRGSLPLEEITHGWEHPPAAVRLGENLVEIIRTRAAGPVLR